MGQPVRAGDVVFVRGKGIISTLIKWIDKGEFSHVVIALENGNCINAEYGTRISIVPFEYDDYKVIDLKLTKEEKKILNRIAQNYVGKKYDYGEILHILLKRFFKYKGRNRFNSPNNYICSGLVNDLLTSIGKIPDGTDLTDCTPNQLYSYLNYQYGNQEEEVSSS